jgi:hypothetical protein
MIFDKERIMPTVIVNNFTESKRRPKVTLLNDWVTLLQSEGCNKKRMKKEL